MQIDSWESLFRILAVGPCCLHVMGINEGIIQFGFKRIREQLVLAALGS